MFLFSRSLSLRTMALFFLITIVFLTIVFGVFYTLSVNKLTDQALLNSEQNLNLMKSNLDLAFGNLTVFMNSFTTDELVFFKDEGTVRAYFERYRRLFPDQSVVMAIESDGVLAISNQQLLYSLKVDTGYLHNLAKTNRMVVTGPYYSPLLASRAIGVIRSLIDAQSGREILVVCEVSVNNLFSKLIQKMEPYETLVVLDANRETVYINPSTLTYLKPSSDSGLLDVSDDLRGALSALGEGSHELAIGGRTQIVQMMTGGQGWKLCVLMDAGEFYKDIRSVKDVYLLVGALALFALTGVSMLLSMWVLRPIRVLASQMDDISSDEKIVLPAVSRKDEIGKLQQSFERLLKRLRNASAERMNMERKRHELEYKVLQNQIQPHFLFNIHICMDSLLEQNKIAEARRMLASIDALLRISIGEKELIPLEEEVKLIKMYVALQQIRLHDAFDFILEGWEPFRDAQVPKLLVQPIIENAIYHGLVNLSRRGIIRMAVCEMDEQLHISVEDNGRGIPEERLSMVQDGTPGSLAGRRGLVSIGLHNVRERIRMYYGSGCGLYVSSREEIGTRVEMVIDKRPNIMNESNL